MNQKPCHDLDILDEKWKSTQEEAKNNLFQILHVNQKFKMAATANYNWAILRLNEVKGFRCLVVFRLKVVQKEQILVPLQEAEPQRLKSWFCGLGSKADR